MDEKENQNANGDTCIRHLYSGFFLGHFEATALQAIVLRVRVEFVEKSPMHTYIFLNHNRTA